jgi:hypothetical protein
VLRAETWQELDDPNLIDALESLGKHDRQELRRRLRGLVMHLLHCRDQREGRQHGQS